MLKVVSVHLFKSSIIFLEKLFLFVIGGVLDKYLKNSMKIDKIENEEIGRKTRNKINDNKDLYAQLAGTEIEN